MKMKTKTESETGMGDRSRRVGARCRIALLCALLLFAVGCGRKAPPRPPAAKPLPKVSGLAARLDGDRVTITWKLTPLAGRLAKDARFALYRDALPSSVDVCPNCPPRYELVAQVPYDPNAPLVDKVLVFQYVETVATGYRYRYQVVLRLASGRQGDPPDPVEVILD
jgi:hypothetical protein